MIEGLLLCIPNNPRQIRIPDADIHPDTHARGALLELGAAGVQHLPAILLRRDASAEGRLMPRFRGHAVGSEDRTLIPSAHSAPGSQPAPERSLRSLSRPSAAREN